MALVFSDPPGDRLRWPDGGPMSQLSAWGLVVDFWFYHWCRWSTERVQEELPWF